MRKFAAKFKALNLMQKFKKFRGLNLREFTAKFTALNSREFTQKFMAKFMAFSQKFTLKKAIKFTLLAGILAFFGAVIFIYINFSVKDMQNAFEARYSRVLLDKNEEILSTFINKNEQWHLRADFIPQKLKIAVINYEDKDFYSHFGVDFSAIFRAFYKNLTGSKKSGASTISMQVIKLYEQNKRTYLNKFIEMIKALRLENELKKDEILALYLNNAPYGGNLVGFNSAILFYFDKNPRDLSWAEAALLAILPNAPGLINLEKNKTKLTQKRNALLKKLHTQGHFDEDLLNLALNEPLPKFKPRKNVAAHLAYKILSDTQKRAISSIDKNLQMKFEAKAKEFSAFLKGMGIKNLAVILADTKTRKVLAYLGSQDFYDSENLGQVNGAAAKRSVGSTLKPFLYALSIDDGLICEDSLMLDVPTFFSNFAPQNASKRYFGMVRAKEALQKSLNVPFVSLLQDFGQMRFFLWLKSALNFSDENYAKYGLSLILGTKEMSLEDLTKLYLALGNYGEMAEISYLRDENLSKTSQIFSSGSAFLTLKAMRDVARIGFGEFSPAIISWKTGTSYGRKDAWALGSTPRYTLGVWVGNFSGEANANLFGVSIAGELFFELLNLLENTREEFTPSPDLTPLKIDNATGYRYDLNVSYAQTLYPRNAKPLRVSPFLKKVYEFNGREVNSLDSDFKNAQSVVKLDLPPHALAFLKEAKVAIKDEKKVKILYPKNGINIINARDFRGKNALIVRVANLKNKRLFWYLNGALIYEGSDSSKELYLNSGKYELFIISQDGENDSIQFGVE